MKRSERLGRFSVILAASTLLSGASVGQDLTAAETNLSELVEMFVEGEVAPAVKAYPPAYVHADGSINVLPGPGGVTLNYRTGDSAIDIAGDHVEPAVSVYALGVENSRTSWENAALNALASIGNEATVITGDAKGARGVVVGKHGGNEHVIVDFPRSIMENMAVGDRIKVRAVGAGMRFTNIEGIKMLSVSPRLVHALEKAGMGIDADGNLQIGVTHIIPAGIMGSGLGYPQAYTGDYDVQLFDKAVTAEHRLETLRFGDLVAIVNSDVSFGPIYMGGAVTIGVIVHSRSDRAGHGPGVTALFTSSKGLIKPHIDAAANLRPLLNIE